MVKNDSIKQQVPTVCTNSTASCQQNQAASEELTKLKVTLIGNSKYDAPPPPLETPLQVIRLGSKAEGFRDTHTASASISVVGALFIIYGLLA
jgi:hypothetical protein